MGTITSLGIGSGLDLNGMLDQLKNAEQQKLKPVEQQIDNQDTRISAFGQLKSALSEFQDASKTLNDSNLYSSLSTSTSGDAVEASADKEAVAGSYEVTVKELASRGTLASEGVDDAETELVSTTQDMTLTFGNNDTADVSIEAGSSLEDVRDAINADENAGVNASIVNDGSSSGNYRLALSSAEAGSDASISDFSLNGLNVDDSTKNTGSDADLTVNGVGITSGSNQVEGAIQGVTLDLAEKGDSTVEVQQDTLAVREAVNGFVDAYNGLKETTGDLTSFNAETGQAGELNGDSSVRMVESRLRSVMGGSSDTGSEFSMLNDVGISMEVDGTLSLDSDKLDDVLSNDQQALSDFFTGVDGKEGFAAQAETTVGQMLSDNGAVENAITGAENRIESLNQRHERMEQSVDRTVSRYRSQFSELDSMVAQMNQTSSYLSQQLSGLGGQ